MTAAAGSGRLAAVAAVLVLAAGACADPPRPSTSAGAPKTIAGFAAGQALKTMAAGRLTACTTVPTPRSPSSEGGLDGIDIELVRAVANRLALAPRFERVAPGDIFKALAAGRCDLWRRRALAGK